MFKQYKVRLTFKNRPSTTPRSVRTQSISNNSQEQDMKLTQSTLRLHLQPRHRRKTTTKKDCGQYNQFWGCIALPKQIERKIKTNKPNPEVQRRAFSSSQNLFLKYMKRRPRLQFTNQAYRFPAETIQNGQKTMAETKENSLIQRSFLIKKRVAKNRQTNSTAGSYTDYQGQELGKIIEQLTTDQLYLYQNEKMLKPRQMSRKNRWKK